VSVLTNSSRRGRNVHQAQALVEFAIILPVMLLMTLGLIDLGRAFVFGVAVQEGTRQAARLAGNAANDVFKAQPNVTDQAVLGRLIGSSSPALDGCTPLTAPPQTCNGFTLSVQVDTGIATYTSIAAARSANALAGSKVTVTAAGPVALLPGVSTGIYGLSLPQINVQGKSAMVIL
jgi:Flp pilus assembly protein TadG